jgi:hypothetical protein
MHSYPVTLLLLLVFLRVACGLWATASLSAARTQLASASLAANDLLFFAGGAGSSGKFFTLRSLPAFLSPLRLIARPAVSKIVDVCDLSSGSWTTAALSQPRKSLCATSLFSMAMFAGGRSLSGEPSQFLHFFFSKFSSHRFTQKVNPTLSSTYTTEGPVFGRQLS